MNPKPKACEGCPAYRWGVGFVPPEGPLGAKVALVGQGPGEQEAEFDRPFYEGAPSGWRLRNWLRQTRPPLLEKACLFTNVVWCWLPKAKPGGVPKGNRAPTPAEVAYCTARHLLPLFATMPRLERVVAVGQPAAAFLLGPERARQRFLGTTHRVHLPTPQTEESHGDPS